MRPSVNSQPEDRAAILLRYFEQLDLRSVGEALGTNEDAAQKRVTRALEKLHTLLKRQGVTLSAATLGPPWPPRPLPPLPPDSRGHRGHRASWGSHRRWPLSLSS